MSGPVAPGVKAGALSAPNIGPAVRQARTPCLHKILSQIIVIRHGGDPGSDLRLAAEHADGEADATASRPRTEARLACAMTLVRNGRLANRLNSGQVIEMDEGRLKACKVWQIKDRAGACAHGSIARGGETLWPSPSIFCAAWPQDGMEVALRKRAASRRCHARYSRRKAARYGDLTQQRGILVATQPPRLEGKVRAVRDDRRQPQICRRRPP